VCVCVRVSKEKKITGKKITFNNPWQTVGDALWEENNTHNLIKPEQQYRHAATVLVWLKIIIIAYLNDFLLY